MRRRPLSLCADRVSWIVVSLGRRRSGCRRVHENKIAHGERCDMEPQDYVDLYNTVLELMERFRDDVERAAATRSYRC